jgi:hypothetical protein
LFFPTKKSAGCRWVVFEGEVWGLPCFMAPFRQQGRSFPESKRNRHGLTCKEALMFRSYLPDLHLFP